ncbi:MAG: glycosyltransferase [Dehalococcoidia bacterium]|nr:glycosyltransferase [Dehalococcoidia bacterium]MCB9485695.1 glycosyltransferase [Thermoflexaceae bacterium]
MRIAMVSAHTSPLAPLGGRETGGMNVYVLELSRELGRIGFEVDIFTRLDGVLPAIEDVAPNVRLVRIEAGPAALIEKETIVDHLPEFATNMRRFAAAQPVPYGVVHSHYWQSGWAGGILARASDVPHVVMFHTLGEVKNRARISEHEPVQRIHHERNVVRRADAIVTASDHERVFLERYYGADPGQVHTIPCGIDLDLFYPRDRTMAREQLGLDPAAPVLLWVGRLEKLKGVDILVSAAAQLAERDFTLLIVGGDDRAHALRGELEAQAAAEGVAANVRFDGAVSHDSLPLYYSAADVVVVPSYYESFGLVAVEAMACGTPVVASRVGGLQSTVADGVTGYLIPWRCPEPFSEKLEVLLNNPELRANFGIAARRSVERYRWSRIGSEMAAFYSHVYADHWHGSGNEGIAGISREAFEAAVVAAAR